MTTDDQPPDLSLLTRIASIESKVRRICDLIPISTWGFNADVHEKLRQRKHRIVNKKLSAKEKRTLTNSKKQHLARTVGGVCRRVSEVIDLLGTSSVEDVLPKKVLMKKVLLDGPIKNSGDSNWEKKEKGQSTMNEMGTEISCKKSQKVAQKEESGSTDESDRDETLVLHQECAPTISSVKPENKAIPSSANDIEVNSDDEVVENVLENKIRRRLPCKLEEVEAKRSKFSVEPVQCVTKDQALDALEQRELAIRKLQEKLKSMKAIRQNNKKASRDPSAALKFEQERKLKRRMSKMKMKQRRSEEKRQKVYEQLDAKREMKEEKSEDEVVSFSKFDFLVKSGNKKRRLSTSEKKQKFTGKDYKSLINKVEKREEKLKKLRDAEPGRAAEVENDIKWNRAVNKAQGVKVKDNIELLKKGLKRKEKMKEKRKQNWLNREKNVERERAKKQEKRKENLQKRIEDKRKNKLKVMRKKGRVL